MKILKILVSAMLAILLCFGGNVSFANENEYVNVPDYNLKRGFLEALNSLDGESRVLTVEEIRNAKFKKEDLRRIKSLSPEVCVAHNCQEEGVKVVTLEGIEHCVNLENLRLVNQRVTDLTPLTNLTKLKKIDIRNNSNGSKVITNIDALRNLTNLESLNLNQAKLTNISALENLTNLTELSLMGTKISDISPLQNLINLRYLDISLNNISDVSPLKNLTKLETLLVSNNPDTVNNTNEEKIVDISMLENLKKLKELHASNHSINDISVVRNFEDLTILDIQNNNIKNLEPLLVLPKLTTLWLENNKDGITNNFSNYTKARASYNNLNKETLTKNDKNVINELLNSAEGITNYFEDETLGELQMLLFKLNNSNEVTNEVFKNNQLNVLAGKVFEVINHKGKQGYQGKGIEWIKSKLPKSVDILVEKSSITNGEKDKIGKLEVDENGNEVLKIAVLDENGELYKDELTFISSKDSSRHTTNNGFLTVNTKMLSPLQYLETTFTLENDNFSAKQIFTKVTPTKIGILVGDDYAISSDENFTEKLVIKLSKKKNTENNLSESNSSEIANNNETSSDETGENNKELDNNTSSNDTNIDNNLLGLVNDKLYFNVVDSDNNFISGLNISAVDRDGMGSKPMVAVEENNKYYFKYIYEDYDYPNIKINSEIYKYKDEESRGFATDWKMMFKKIFVNGRQYDIETLSPEQKKEFFTIQLISKEISARSSISNSELRTANVLNTTENTNIHNENVAENSNTEERIRISVPVEWDTNNLEDKVGEYELVGKLVLPETISNPNNLTAKLKLKIIEKPISTVEYFGDVINIDNKEHLKLAIIDKNKKLITEEVVVTDGEHSYISKDGYVTIPVKNGVKNISLDDKKYKSNIVTYASYFNKIYEINGKMLREISKLGLGRQLRIIVTENSNDETSPTEEIHIENNNNKSENIDKENNTKDNNVSTNSNKYVDDFEQIENNDDLEKLETILGKENEYKISVESKNLLMTDVLEVELVDEESKKNILKNIDNNTDYDIFDIIIKDVDGNIKLYNNNEEYKVTIVGKKDIDSVYYYNEQTNELEKIDAIINNNKAEFKVSHFSKYVVKYENKKFKKTLSSTGEASNYLQLILAFIFIALVVRLLKRKSKLNN